MLTFTPAMSAEEAVTMVVPEFVFVIDCSGSMSGSRIDRARTAVKICLRGLPQKCLFNLIAFGTEFTSLFPASVEYNTENFKKAGAFAD
jgi:uncharacterized protein with von Willebrand factor type A (vWA) domain